MSYILSSDWHAHAWSQFANTTTEGLNSRLADILNMIHMQAQMAETHDAKRIYVAGDVFHVRGSIKPTVFNPVAQTLAECAEEYGVEFRIMPGNHDLESNETEALSSAITALGAIPGVTVIDGPRVFADDKVVMIPWHNTREGLTAAIKDVAENCDPGAHDYDLILHTGINGVLIGMPDHGWAPSELAEFGFGRVFSGHYHHHKSFEVTYAGYPVEVTSIGALTHQTWSDVGTKAGFLIVEGDGFDLVESVAPRFIDFGDIEDIADIKGNFVRVRGVEMDEAEIRETREDIMVGGALGCVIDPLIKRDATREGAPEPGKAVRLEAQISDYTKEKHGTLAPEIEVEALDVLNKVRSAT